MKNISLKMIVMIVAMATVVTSCKKVDGPTPSDKVYLTAKTWDVTNITDNSGNSTDVNSANCNGIVLQFASTGKLYYGQGCNTPAEYGTWELNDKTIVVPGDDFEIQSIDATTFVFKSGSNTFTATAK